MIVRSVNVGKPVVIAHDGKETSTAIHKQAAAGRVYLGTLNFVGDQQADLVHHGGPEKAVCVYSHDRYGHWEQELGKPLGVASFGENLTVEGLTEETAHIGDVYQVGEATVQVCQPRIPCFKLGLRLGVPDMPARVIAAGYTGFYLRVLKEGHVAAGDRLTLVSRPANAPTIALANRIFHHEKDDLDGARTLLAAEGLAAVWRKKLEKRLK